MDDEIVINNSNGSQIIELNLYDEEPEISEIYWLDSKSFKIYRIYQISKINSKKLETLPLSK
tara:strand:- start:111 stop:296 length:186 start_codon:yes stop_codon:yes gene_type:complete